VSSEDTFGPRDTDDDEAPVEEPLAVREIREGAGEDD
jgi:hypothetical protein